MRTRLPLVAALASLALTPAAAQAAHPAAATVTNCSADHMTVVGKVKLTGKAARKVRGASLQLQFQALPLFGLPQAGGWRDLGKKNGGSGQQAFTGLSADSWGGVVRWRFKKGSRTVASGDERSQPLKIGGVRGAAFCTLFEGAKPVDSTPPAVFVVPDDSVWHRGPTAVQVLAQDDFSGVRSVRYSLDGGPITAIRNGSTFTIDSEGRHRLDVAATDVSGNTATRTVTVQVDQAPPTKPQLQRPFSVTASTTPTFQWTPSSDSGSGLRGYLLQIRRASDGSTVSVTPFDPNTTQASPQALSDGETYIATVVAVDNTDTPFTTESDPLTFRVDTHPDVIGSDPAQGAILSGARKDGNLTVTLDRPADSSTLSGHVLLDRVEPSSDPAYSVSCNSDCTQVIVDPSGTLPEGRYTLSLSGVKSQEGLDFPNPAIKFAVAFREDSDGDNTAQSLSPCASGVMTTDATPSPSSTTITTATNNEAGFIAFGYSVAGPGTGGLRILDNGTPVYDSSDLSGSGQIQTTFIIPTAGSHAITTQYYVKCTAGQAQTSFSASNIVASRQP
ncbi:MAG: OmpL47-type beta-barrel domain-containing protein [Thermoleophilaceae bacterium]